MRRGAKAISGSREAADAQPSRAPARSKPAPRGKIAAGLHLVATPIGNLGDIGRRAMETLAAADIVACEDTRVTGKLLSLLGIEAALAPYHEHNAERARPALLARMRSGEAVALVSDAGTPLLSDPGYRLVRACLAEDIAVTSVPGPSALLCALQLSGLPCGRFLFAGFLPPRTTARRQALSELAVVPATLVFYESPRRLAASLADMAAVLGNREAAVARELTKLFEEVRRGQLAALAARYEEDGAPKGEVTVVVAPPAASPVPTADAVDELLRRELAGATVKDAAATVAAATGLPKREIYARAVALGRGGERK